MTSSSKTQIFVEITVISAHGLKNPTLNALFSRRLKPFATLAAAPPSGSLDLPHAATSVDSRGGSNPTWNETFRLPVDPAFFANPRSFVYLHVRARLFAGGEALLGWCQIPTGDILSPPVPPGSVGYLSYRLSDRDGTRGHGTVNVSVRVDPQPQGCCATTTSSSADSWQTVIGWPVASAFG